MDSVRQLLEEADALQLLEEADAVRELLEERDQVRAPRRCRYGR